MERPVSILITCDRSSLIHREVLLVKKFANVFKRMRLENVID